MKCREGRQFTQGSSLKQKGTQCGMLYVSSSVLRYEQREGDWMVRIKDLQKLFMFLRNSKCDI